MSGVSTQGVGAGVSADADRISAELVRTDVVSATAVKSVFVENRVIRRAPSKRSKKVTALGALNKSRTPLPRQYDGRLAMRCAEKSLLFPASAFATILRFWSRSQFAKSRSGG